MNALMDGYEDSPFQDRIRTMRKRATESIDERIPSDTERARQYFDWDEDDVAARELREQED